MPGIATHFQVVEDFIKKHEKTSTTLVAGHVAKIMQDHKGYAYLGALGPALADFIPQSKSQSAKSQHLADYAKIWKIVLRLALRTGAPDDPYPGKGILVLLEEIKGTLDYLEQIAKEEKIYDPQEAQEKVLATAAALESLQEQMASLKESNNSDVVALILLIRAGMKPAIASKSMKPVPPSFWAIRELLCWKRTGRFVEVLINNATKLAAKNKDNESYLAYAYGYLIAYVAQIVGAPFVNSIVGGPYRAHWWRQRWINNHVDSWVYGRYQLKKSVKVIEEDVFDPSYKEWANLCDANLHDRIAPQGFLKEEIPPELVNIGPEGITPDFILNSYLLQDKKLPSILPSKFTNYWIEAFDEVYGNVYEQTPKPFDASDLSTAYLMTWLMLWAQTAGKTCIKQPTIEGLGEDCVKTPPDWIYPAGSGKPSGNYSKPNYIEPEDPDPDEGCDAFDPFEVAGVALTFGWLDDDFLNALRQDPFTAATSSTDWSKVRCTLYWFRVSLSNMQKPVHELLTNNTFAYPFITDFSDKKYLPITTVKARVFTKEEKTYPRRPWDSAKEKDIVEKGLRSTPWMIFPSEGTEYLATTAYLKRAYPYFFIDGNPSGATTGDIKTGSAAPPNPRVDAEGEAILFGDIFSNLRDIFTNGFQKEDAKKLPKLTIKLPDWNLDADRGLAFPTWRFVGDIPTEGATETSPVIIEQES